MLHGARLQNPHPHLCELRAARVGAWVGEGKRSMRYQFTKGWDKMVE
jgi:hypothetical protein